MMKNIKKWFFAIRPQTLLVSMSSVVAATAIAFDNHECQWLPAVLCLLFAMLAQTTSNLANDYADFKNGTDNSETLGPDRKLVSGEISMKAMKNAITIAGISCFLVGLSLLYWGGLILLPFGLVIIAVAFCYSMGPFPLSYHGLGDIAVVLFFGIIPVSLTYFVLTNEINLEIIAAGFALGLIVDELLIVNNVRDAKTDAMCNKITTVGIFGVKAMKIVFLFNPLIACGLGFYFLKDNCSPLQWAIASVPLLVYSIVMYSKLVRYKGKELNSLLGKASLEAMIFAISIAAAALI